MNWRYWENLEIEISSKFIALKSGYPLKVLSSAVLNGGFCESRSIINYRVKENFDHSDPEEFLREKVEEIGLPRPAVGMMTAADVGNPGTASLQEGDFAVSTIVTAGITLPIAAGTTSSRNEGMGTINTIVLANGDMNIRSMVDAVRTSTEAKSIALREMDLRGERGVEAASGTATDAVTIACTGRGGKAEYAGPITPLGNLIGRTARRATKDALEKCGLTSSRPLLERLEERGLSFDLLAETAREAFVNAPDSGPREGVPELLGRELRKALKDVNVAALILSGLRLEEDGKSGLIPGLSSEEFESDPVFLLADEILGMRIANYINGSKGVFEFARIDRSKPGVLGDLGPFLDDVIGGLIAGACSRTYERGR